MKISKNLIGRFLYIIIFLLLCRNIIIIYPLYNIYIIDRIYSYLAIAVAGIFIIWFCCTHLHYNMNIVIILLLQTVMAILSTIFNADGTLWIPIMSFVYVCAIYFFAIYITEKKRFYNFINDISTVFLILIIINLFLMGANGNYYKEYKYFLGLENQISFTFLLGLYFHWLNSIYNNKKKMLTIYIAVYVISSVIIGSASGVVALFIFLLVNFIPFAKKIINRAHTFIFSIIIVIILFFLVFYTLFGVENNFLNWLICDVLKKDMTFTGRTDIWNILLKKVSYNAILGYGYHENSDIFYVNGYALGAHNTFFALLYNGGTVGVCIMMIIFWFCSKYIDKIAFQNIKTVHKIMFLLISIPMMSEGVSLNPIYIVLFIGVGISINITKKDYIAN